MILVALWAIYSTQFLDALAVSEEVKIWLRPLKSLLYIVITGTLLYSLIYMGQSRLKKSSKSLIDEKEKYQLLVDESPIAMMAYQNEKIIFANPTAVKMLEATAEKDFFDMDITHILHPNDKNASLERTSILEKEGHPKYPVALRLLTLKGNEVEVELTHMPLNIMVLWPYRFFLWMLESVFSTKEK